MAGIKFLCRHCHKLFNGAEKDEFSGHQISVCPSCGMSDHLQLKVFESVPDGDEIGPPPWEFVCHPCRTYFQIDAPRGPDEAGNIRCPACGSAELERFHVCSLETMARTCFG